MIPELLSTSRISPQHLVHILDRHAPFPHRRAAALHRTRPHIARRENPRHARLEGIGPRAAPFHAATVSPSRIRSLNSNGCSSGRGCATFSENLSPASFEFAAISASWKNQNLLSGRNHPFARTNNRLPPSKRQRIVPFG